MADVPDLATMDLYSIFNTSGSLKSSFNISLDLNKASLETSFSQEQCDPSSQQTQPFNHDPGGPHANHNLNNQPYNNLNNQPYYNQINYQTNNEPLYDGHVLLPYSQPYNQAYQPTPTHQHQPAPTHQPPPTHQPAPTQCHFCSTKYETNYSSWDHCRDHAWVCPECEFTTDRKNWLVEHQLEANHPGTKVPDGTYYFFCLLCNGRVQTTSKLDAILNLKKHKQQAHNDLFPSYYCRICDYATFKKSAYTLMEHEKQSHPSPETFNLRHFQCSVCKRLLVSRAALMHHKRTHTKRFRERNTPYKRYKNAIKPLLEQQPTGTAGEFVCISDYSNPGPAPGHNMNNYSGDNDSAPDHNMNNEHYHDAYNQQHQSHQQRQPSHYSSRTPGYTRPTNDSYKRLRLYGTDGDYGLAGSTDYGLDGEPFAAVPAAKNSVYNTRSQQQPCEPGLQFQYQPCDPLVQCTTWNPSRTEPASYPPEQIHPSRRGSVPLPSVAGKCPVCSESFEPNYGSWDHSQAHAWACGECSFTGDSKSMLENHQFAEVHPCLHFNPDTCHFYCLLCNERRTVSSSQDPSVTLTQHLMEHHLEMYPVYSCNLCDFKTHKTTSLALLEHEKQFHPDVEGTEYGRHYKCPCCARVCVSKRGLQRHHHTHFNREHLLKEAERSAGSFLNAANTTCQPGGYECSVCKYKVPSKHWLRIHYQDDHGDESAQLCVKCKTWFRGEEKLEAHLRAVHKIVAKDLKSVRRRPDPNRKKKGPVDSHAQVKKRRP